MGKSEKLVVLSVLLFVVVLFVWSLQGGSTDHGEGTGGSTVYGAERDQQGAASNGEATMRKPSKPKQQPSAPAAGSTGNGPAASPNVRDTSGSKLAQAGPQGSGASTRRKSSDDAPKLLFAEKGGARSSMTDRAPRRDESDGTSVPRGPILMQPGWDLVTTAGLEATVDPTMFLMTPPKGATWATLARDLYGNESKAALLRHNNEGMNAPQARIFVPAKDDLGRDAAVRIVEVLKGESLWQVATRTLDKGSRWKEIYEANRDVISDPDFVAPGTRLRVPAR